MSLINQMLQDLEKRSPEQAGATLPEGVRSSSLVRVERATNGMRHWTLVMGLVIASSGVTWWLTAERDHEPGQEARVLEAVSPAVAPLSTPSEPVASAPGGTARVVQTNAREKQEPRSRAEARRHSRPEKPEAAGEGKSGGNSPRAAASAVAVSKTASTADDAKFRAEQAYKVAAEAYSNGRFDAARANANEALKLQPGHIAARQLLVRQNVELGQVDRAVVLLRDGIAQGGGAPSWWTMLAQLELGRGRLADARAVINEAPGTVRNQASFNSLAAAIAQRQGDLEGAADFYRRALGLNGRSGRDWVGLALVLEKQGHGPEALESFRRALATEGLPDELAQLARNRLARTVPAGGIAGAE